MKSNPALAPLDKVLGTWALTGSHPLMPGVTVKGASTFERIEGGAFIRMHSKMEDPRFPEGVAIFGTDDGAHSCTMIYFDVRGVSRNYDVKLRDDGFDWSRDDPQFSQRFHVTFSADGRTMESKGQMKKAGGDWEPDLSLSYERKPTGDR